MGKERAINDSQKMSICCRKEIMLAEVISMG